MVKYPLLQKHKFGYLEPVEKPSQEQLSVYYAEKYFQLGKGNYRASYSDDEIQYIDAKLHQQSQQLELLRGNLPGTLLDVGCGEGFALSYFDRKGWQVEGLDHSIAGVRVMNPHCERFVTNGDVNALIEERLQLSIKYDVIILTNVLEHVIDPPGLLSGILKLLAPDGIAVVTVPNDFSAFQKYLLSNQFVDQPYWVALPDHLAYFNKESLVATCEAIGFSCKALLSDFPIEWYLLHEGSNYIRDRALGGEAHKSRIHIETLLDQLPYLKLKNFYSALADVGMGRNLIAYLMPDSR